MTNQTELTSERIEEALHYLVPIYDSAHLDGYKRNLGTALAALRAEQERLNPQPLTWEELSGMVGEPVWTTGEYCGLDGWDIIEEVYDDSVLFGRSTERPERWNYNLRELSGKLGACAWLAYRTKPEGSAE